MVSSPAIAALLAYALHELKSFCLLVLLLFFLLCPSTTSLGCGSNFLLLFSFFFICTEDLQTEDAPVMLLTGLLNVCPTQ